MKIIALPFAMCLLFAACDKDKFKTEPQAEIKALTPDEVSNGGIISFRAELRDREGDFDSVLLVRKRYNGDVLLGNPDTLRTSFTSFNIPATDQVELNVLFSYGIFRPELTSFFENLANVDNRYLRVGVVVKDKAGNRSSYVESNRIHLRKL